MAAAAAQGQWSETAAIEEQERLFAGIQVGLKFRDQRRCQPASTRRSILRHVDRADRRHFRGAMALGQLKFSIATDLRHVAGLDGRGGRGEDDRDFLEMTSHYGDVAGVILNAFFLLEARLVRLVDHDQAEVGVGQEE